MAPPSPLAQLEAFVQQPVVIYVALAFALFGIVAIVARWQGVHADVAAKPAKAVAGKKTYAEVVKGDAPAPVQRRGRKAAPAVSASPAAAPKTRAGSPSPAARKVRASSRPTARRR